MKKSQLKKGFRAIKKVKDIQCQNGNWDYDEYMRGLANGLILAEACFTGEEPLYLKQFTYEWQVTYQLTDRANGDYHLSTQHYTNEEIADSPGWINVEKFEPSKRRIE